jgi:hypothetical protein
MSESTMDNTEPPQWGRQQQTGADEMLRQMAADTGARIEVDSLGRLVLIHPPRPPAPAR